MADVTHAVNDPFVLDGAPWIRIVPLRTPTLPPATHTPGHAPGHLCFADAAARAIVAGDMVASVGTIIVEPEDGGDMTLYLASLRRLRAEVDAGATRLLPAHGPPIVDGGARLDFY